MSSNESKLATFIKDRKGALLHFIRSRIASNGLRDAEDLLQDSVAGILASGEIEAIGEISGYLFRSIRNRIIDIYRRKDRDRESSLDAIEENTGGAVSFLAAREGSPEDEFERNELRAALFNAIDSLSAKERAVWIATELEGSSFADLAEEWNEPIGTLLSRKSRATKKLQSLLSENGISATGFITEGENV